MTKSQRDEPSSIVLTLMVFLRGTTLEARPRGLRLARSPTSCRMHKAIDLKVHPDNCTRGSCSCSSFALILACSR